jgi:magnesium chelatase subunit D
MSQDTGPGPTDHDRLLTAFACAAADPRLGGVLLFDVPPGLVRPVADLFTAVVAGPGAPPAVVLGSATREDDLWSRIRLRPAGGRIALDVRHGDLVETEEAAPPRTVLVPDLARLGLPGLRAAVTLLGARTASLERDGTSVLWRPRARWLAFARRADAGRLSPHLLDRFPLRLTLPGLRLPGESEAFEAPGPPRGGPPLDEEALAAVLARTAGGAGERRALALARIARALAGAGPAPATTAAHVAQAAELIGLPAAEPPPAAADPADGGRATQPEPGPGPGPGSAPSSPPERQEGLGPGALTRLPAPGPAEPLDPFSDAPGTAAAPVAWTGPYPEDEAGALRESPPLRAPWRHRAAPAAERGPVTGVRRATDLRDLALVPTVVEAAKNQLLPGRDRVPGALTVTAADLRGYARAAEPERMLVLLLDHTCRQGWRWQDVLAPYLQWAYTTRATAAVVETGAADAPNELRATGFVARNVLDPRLAQAMERRPGRASPLAHGLLLAGRLVRHAFQQHASAPAEAWFVVVTDARGNVPLRVSLAGRHDPPPGGGPVGRRGVEDTLAAAASLGALGRMRLHVVLPDVGALPYADLPFALAEALGGTVVAGPGTPHGEEGPGHAA